MNTTYFSLSLSCFLPPAAESLTSSSSEAADGWWRRSVNKTMSGSLVNDEKYWSFTNTFCCELQQWLQHRPGRLRCLRRCQAAAAESSQWDVKTQTANTLTRVSVTLISKKHPEILTQRKQTLQFSWFLLQLHSKMWDSTNWSRSLRIQLL